MEEMVGLRPRSIAVSQWTQWGDSAGLVRLPRGPLGCIWIIVGAIMLYRASGVDLGG
jgi:hypothetical protein